MRMKSVLYFDISGEWVVNLPSQGVTWERSSSSRLELMSISSSEQNLLKSSGDDRRIDWGALYLGAPKGSATLGAFEANAAREMFASGGTAGARLGRSSQAGKQLGRRRFSGDDPAGKGELG